MNAVVNSLGILVHVLWLSEVQYVNVRNIGRVQVNCAFPSELVLNLTRPTVSIDTWTTAVNTAFTLTFERIC